MSNFRSAVLYWFVCVLRLSIDSISKNVKLPHFTIFTKYFTVYWILCFVFVMFSVVVVIFIHLLFHFNRSRKKTTTLTSVCVPLHEVYSMHAVCCRVSVCVERVLVAPHIAPSECISRIRTHHRRMPLPKNFVFLLLFLLNTIHVRVPYSFFTDHRSHCCDFHYTNIIFFLMSIFFILLGTFSHCERFIK